MITKLRHADGAAAVRVLVVPAARISVVRARRAELASTDVGSRTEHHTGDAREPRAHRHQQGQAENRDDRDVLLELAEGGEHERMLPRRAHVAAPIEGGESAHGLRTTYRSTGASPAGRDLARSQEHAALAELRQEARRAVEDPGVQRVPARARRGLQGDEERSPCQEVGDHPPGHR